MGKLIYNIEHRIFLSAKELFFEKGYEHVNMKEISKRADIAVGTLYNYFSNKNELYLSVLENSWNDTFKKLDIILNKEIGEKEKLKSAIRLIYKETFHRRCMGIQVRKSKDLKENEAVENFEEKIKINVEKIFENIKIKKEFKNDKNILDKLVYTLLVNLTMLIDYYPNDEVSNIEFLYSGLVGFFQEEKIFN